MTRPSDGPNPAHAPGVRIGVSGALSELSAAQSDVSAAPSRVERLKKRADFLACAKGRKQHQRAFVLQGRRRDSADADAPAARVGFTVTKKTGNSVARNRIRRRLREAIRLGGPDLAQAGCDYVLIGRREALDAPFSELRGEVDRAFRKIFVARAAAEPNKGEPSPRAADAAPAPRGKRRGRGRRPEPPTGGPA